MMDVRTITGRQAMAMVMRHHYSGRKVGSRHSFGLFDDGQLVGCAVYSIPASYTLCRGVCGPAWKQDVLELSRVVVTTDRYCAAGQLVSRSLRMIGNAVVVSYADCNYGHTGKLYQATNWIYTGQGNAEPLWLHPVSGEVIANTRRHIDKKAEAKGLHWKDLERKPQQGKHRYVYFAGSKRYRRKARAALQYPVLSYPQGPTVRVEIDRAEGMLF